MAHKFFKDKRPHNGITYDNYKKMTIQELGESNPDDSEDKNKSYFEYRKINFQRSSRLEKHFLPSQELITAVKKIIKPQLWMVITETWCGDSAQNLPIISKIARLNSNIDLRIILRDSNLDMMDNYLTNGVSRSIPILVAFDMEGNEIFRWGPRPKSATQLVKKFRERGVVREEYNKKLHLWYGRNRGIELESELVQLLMKSDPATNTVI